MSVKLTETQHVMLSAAAQREDRFLALPLNLKGGAAQKVAAKLIAAGLVKEVRAKEGTPVWRRDAVTKQVYALKLTPAGLKAITPGKGAALSKDAAGSSPIEAAASEASSATPPAFVAPRDGSKISQVVELLRRKNGATLDEVVAATGWLPHTSRAALTGLRKRGYGIEKRRHEDGRSGYIIVAKQASAA